MGGGERRTEAAQTAAVLDSVVEPVNRTLTHIEDLEANILQCLSMAEPEIVAEMPPLHRAQLFLMLAKSATTLFAVRLRCNGIQPDDHPFKSEIERLRLFEEKLERYCDWNRAPLRPSTTINRQAATRLIGHSLPDLSSEQRKGLREISRGEGFKGRVSKKHWSDKKRKFQSSEKHSIHEAAAEFLEKAARELLGSNAQGFKGPLRHEASDEEEMQMA